MNWPFNILAFGIDIFLVKLHSLPENYHVTSFIPKDYYVKASNWTIFNNFFLLFYYI